MTRMWMVPPKLLCRQHLLGEHKELHQLVGTIRAGRLSVIKGHARLGQVQCRSIIKRHEELVAEMIKRGYNHASPLGDFEQLDLGEVDIEKNLADLRHRCERCRHLQQGDQK